MLSLTELQIIYYLAVSYEEKAELKNAHVLYTKLDSSIRNESSNCLGIRYIYLNVLYKLALINYTQNNFGIAYSYIQQSFDGLIANYFFYPLQEVITLKKQLEEKLFSITPEQQSEYENQISILDFLKKKYAHCLYINAVSMSDYNKASLITYYRIKKNMTQEELSENICDSYTLTRYENGSLNPSEENYSKIMKKLGIPEDTIIFHYQTEDIGTLALQDKLLYYFENRLYDKAQAEINNIISKNLLPLTYAENCQFINRVQYTIDYENGCLSLSEYILKLETLLKLSFKEYSPESFHSKPFFTENELLILNNLAIAYEETGDFETSNRLFYNMYEYFENDIHNYTKSYHLFLLNYSNLLGKSGKYEESINISRQGISWLMNHNKGNYLYYFVYNIGWNYIEKHKITHCTEEKNHGIKYIQIAYNLCCLYPESKENLEIISNYYDKINS